MKPFTELSCVFVWKTPFWLGRRGVINLRAIAPSMLCVVALFACEQEPTVQFRSIDPVCIEEAPAPDVWACGESLVIDCNDAEVPEEIYVQVGEDECSGLELVPFDGPFPPGQHEVVIVDENSDTAVCSSELTVTDPVAPIVEVVDLSMWPPNHEMHELTLADCIDEVIDCDPTWTAAIDYITSDEPDEDIGDGNTEGDIVILASDAFALRSERQGGSNGRVYKVFFTVTDGSGNATEAACHVVVDHDKGNGAAVYDGEAHRVEP